MFRESEALAILFEEGYNALKLPMFPLRFFELVAQEADASCIVRRELEAFKSGFNLAEIANSSDREADQIFIQCEGDHAWFFLGSEAAVCCRVRNMIIEALKT